MSATQTEPAGRTTIDGALVGELRAIERALGEACNGIEELAGLRESEVVAHELSWLIQGFTADAMVHLSFMVERILHLRARASGGLSGNEVELLRAAGGEF